MRHATANADPSVGLFRYVADPRSAPILFPMLNLHMQWTARVSLSDCFCPMGKGTGGLKTPGYSKTVLRTETQRLRRPLLMSAFAIAHGQLQMTAHTVSPTDEVWFCTLSCCRQGQPFRLFCPLGQKHRGVENPRILAWKASQSERLTRVPHYGPIVTSQPRVNSPSQQKTELPPQPAHDAPSFFPPISLRVNAARP